MSYRCTNPFLYGEKIFAAGVQVPDDHPILQTHTDFFTRVVDLQVGTETATRAPGEIRTPPLAAADQEAATAAQRAADTQHEEDVVAWLAAEEQYHSDVAAWLTAEAKAKAVPAEPASPTTEAADKPRPQTRRGGAKGAR